MSSDKLGPLTLCRAHLIEKVFDGACKCEYHEVHARCHQSSAVAVRVWRDGFVSIHCSHCDKPIVCFYSESGLPKKVEFRPSRNICFHPTTKKRRKP
jgi:hypothetical protein